MYDRSSHVPFEAVVLAGGLGTRLRGVTGNVPKVLAEVAGRPFIDYVLDNLYLKGCEHAILALGYKAEEVRGHFDSYPSDLEITYSMEDGPLGTGGAIKRALSYANADEVVVLNGDTFFDVDYEGLIAFHRACGAGLTLALKSVDDASRYGSVSLGNGYVGGFSEKGSSGRGLICGGVYAIDRRLLDACPDAFSFERDFEEAYVKDNPVGAYLGSSNCYFIDIGVPEDHRRAQADFTRGIRRAAFFDRDGTINEDTGHLFEIDKLKLIDGTCRLIGEHNAACFRQEFFEHFAMFILNTSIASMPTCS